MTKEQAYEKLELPVGTDLQAIRQKFQQMHNEFQVQIDGAFREDMRQKLQTRLMELEEAFALLNESESMDDSASLPRTEKTFDQTGGSETNAQTKQQQSAPKEQQQAPPPPPPREESQQTQEQAPPVYTAAPAKQKSKAGMFMGIAVAVIVVLAGFYFLSNRGGNPDNPIVAGTDALQDSTAWEAALAGGNEAVYKHYIKQYPNGIFINAAIDSLTRLKGADYAATVAKEAQEQAAINPPAESQQPVATTATTSASTNNTKALIQEGKNLLDRKQFKQAETKLREALNAGDTDAIPYLAGALHGLKRYNEVIQMVDKYPAYHRNDVFQLHIARAYAWLEQHKTAIPWYEKSANQGNAIAQYNLGVNYANGQGVTKNEADAVKWYTKAANQGDADAQNNLGVMYNGGKGVTKDEAEAVKWYTKAANQGNAIAQYNLGVNYDNGRGVAKDEAEAVKWYTKAANQGYTDAQYSLGLRYANGQGVTKDEAEAVKWYTKAANQGNANAQSNLGFMYDNGRGVIKDEKQAHDWYLKAALQGFADAQHNAGFNYANGIGVAKDEDEAIRWYKKAAKQGQTKSINNLKSRGITDFD